MTDRKDREPRTPRAEYLAAFADRRAAILADLQDTTSTYAAIAAKHEVSTARVAQIAKKYGTPRRSRQKTT